MSGRRQKKKSKAGQLAAGRPRPLPIDPSETFATLSFPMGGREASHPGTGLNPRRVVSIYREAESGFPARQADLFEDVIETDGHLRSQVEGRISKVAGKSFTIVPGSKEQRDIVAADAVERALKSTINIRPLFQHMLRATAYGYSFAEIIWERDSKGMWMPVWFEPTAHRRIRFDANDVPTLLTKAQPQIGEALQPGKWIAMRNAGRQTVRTGLMRTATWWSLFKRLSVRDWIIFAEKFGLPYIVGKYNALDATDEDKAVLRQAIQELGKDSVTIMSDAAEIAIEHVKGGGKSEDVHGAITSLCNSEISKLFSGATLAAESGGPGSFALGEVHDRQGFDLVAGDAELLSDRIQEDLIKPFLKFNGFIDVLAPALKIHVVREIDPLKRVQVLDIVRNKLGVEIDVHQIREENQLRPATEGDRPAPSDPPNDPAPQ